MTGEDLFQEGSLPHFRGSTKKPQSIGSLAFFPWVPPRNQVLLHTASIICNQLISLPFFQWVLSVYPGKLEKKASNDGLCFTVQMGELQLRKGTGSSVPTVQMGLCNLILGIKTAREIRKKKKSICKGILVSVIWFMYEKWLNSVVLLCDYFACDFLSPPFPQPDLFSTPVCLALHLDGNLRGPLSDFQEAFYGRPDQRVKRQRGQGQLPPSSGPEPGFLRKGLSPLLHQLLGLGLFPFLASEGTDQSSKSIRGSLNPHLHLLISAHLNYLCGILFTAGVWFNINSSRTLNIDVLDTFVSPNSRVFICLGESVL